jgi:glycosyltransferase involved in cell wall biosynthesis
MRDHKVIVVMPARNAALTLVRTVGSVPADFVDEIILVDDKSTDDTVVVAQELAAERGHTTGLPPLHVIPHPHNVGYGGNQKTCYMEALQREADVVVMLHPDGQYEPTLIPHLVDPIVRGEADLVLGSRMMEPGQARAGGMPLHKRLANRGLTGIENRILGTSFSELHTGYRAYSRALLMGIPFLRNANDFSFDSEVVMQAVHFGYRIAEVPARSRYFDDASSIRFWPASVYAVKTLWAGARLMLHRRGVVPSKKFRP